MSTTLDDLQQMTERHAAVCAELIDDALAALRAVRADLDNPETPEARDKAIERMPRALLSVRQCLAMERRVRTEGLKDTQAVERRDREQAEAADEARKEALARRTSRVFLTIAGLMEDDLAAPDDADEDEFLERREDLRTRLSEERFETEFAGLSPQEIILRVCDELSVPAPIFGPDGDIVGRVRPAAAPPGSAQVVPAVPPAIPPPEPAFRYSSA